MNCKVYRNLTNGKLSVKDTKTGLVIGWCDDIYLSDVNFIVSEKGRQRVIDTGHKNVHAYVQGNILLTNKFVFNERHEHLFLFPMLMLPTYGSIQKWMMNQHITYNPKKHKYFTCIETGERVYSSEFVKVSCNGEILC